MDNKYIEEKIFLKLSEYKISDTIFDTNTSLKEMGLDSMDIMKLIVELEELFNITFDDDELIMDNFKTVDNITTRISNHLFHSKEVN